MNKNRWFLVALFVMLLAAPHAMLIRVVVDTADPLYWVLTRFLAASVIMIPIVLFRTKLSQLRAAWKPVLISSVSITCAVLLYVYAIYYSQASYVSILTMITPIILIFVSAHFFRESITRRKIAGITLAMIGALIIVAVPLALAGKVGQGVYPLATVMTIAQSFFFVIAIITMRQANEAGVPMASVVGISAPVGVLITAPLFYFFGDMTRTPTDLGFLLAVIYSGIGIAVLFRALSVVAYEHIGAIPTAALQYFETLAAVLLPVLIIGEKLSIEMVIGGILILSGVYLIESHNHGLSHLHLTHRHH